MVDCEIVQRRAILTPQVEQIRKTTGDAQRHVRALALQEHVGRDGGAVHESFDTASAKGAHGVQHCFALIGRRR
jgi:hypothetical protein